jgi:hypothetical protein
VKTKKILLICACAIVFIGGFIGFSLHTMLKVRIEEGIVNEALNIPVIGAELAGFPAEAEIQYFLQKYFGGARVYFSGTASHETIRQYFEKHRWDNSLDSTVYDEIFQNEPYFQIIPSEDNEVFVKLPDEENPNKITVYYIPSTKRFFGVALIFYR